MPLGRLVRLEIAPADADAPVVAAEMIESRTGKLIPETDVDVDGVGTKFQPGDVLFSKLRPYLAKVHAAESGGAAIGDLLVLRPNAQTDSKFLAYSILNPSLIGLVAASTYGAKMPRASWDFIKALPLWAPDLARQRAIANFLDRETAKIDSLIEKQNALIDRLRERRLSAVTQAVEGSHKLGRPTGSRWHGSLPVGWQLGRIKDFAARITDGAHISPETDGGEYDFVSTQDLKNGTIDFASALKTTPATYLYMVKTGCQPRKGDVLFSKDGTVGERALVHDDWDFVVASSLVIISPGRLLNSRYLYHALGSRAVQENARAFMRGAGLPRLSVANLARLELPVPPPEEQRAIASYLDLETAKIDILIAKAERFVELVRERRSALITAAVTGQIDVTGEVAA